MKNLIKDKKSLGALIISFIGVLLMLIYELGFYKGTRDSNDEKIITWFYFTFISNVIGVVFFWLKSFAIKERTKHFQRFEILAVVNLTVTMLIFWSVLAPANKTWSYPFATIQNLFIHLITPVLIIAIFLVDIFKNKETNSLNSLKSSLINLLMPLVWITIAIIIYFSLGADKDSAIYSFLDFKNHALMAGIAIPGIAILYFGLTFGLMILKNKKRA